MNYRKTLNLVPARFDITVSITKELRSDPSGRTCGSTCATSFLDVQSVLHVGLAAACITPQDGNSLTGAQVFYVKMLFTPTAPSTLLKLQSPSSLSVDDLAFCFPEQIKLFRRNCQRLPPPPHTCHLPLHVSNAGSLLRLPPASLSVHRSRPCQGRGWSHSPPSRITSCSLSSELFLSINKHAVISPILKKINRNLELPSLSNYRPIALLIFTGKRVYLHSAPSSFPSIFFFFLNPL